RGEEHETIGARVSHQRISAECRQLDWRDGGTGQRVQNGQDLARTGGSALVSSPRVVVDDETIAVVAGAGETRGFRAGDLNCQRSHQTSTLGQHVRLELPEAAVLG